ncbi:MAG: hypothetical protein LBP34_00270 [Flavobacteriaceae bacterium]|jgi:hypothetical protein|nr:hypothetical protein [Flavobacteriaceae bacterium]
MKKSVLLLILILSGLKVQAQHMDIEAMMRDRKLKVNGGINANAMFYNSNMDQDREPLIYTLTGNLNFSYMTFSMPFSYTLTNQGDAFNYNVPFDFNRFSLTPKYKWIKAYIGDNAMSFSEYTLNGHPFRGLGVELTPRGAFKFSAMGGRLLKAVEGNDSIGLPAVYERYGYGTKIGYEKEKYKIEAIGFYAEDKKNSVKKPTDVVPMSNYVGSLKLSTTLIKNVNFEAEYAVSVLEDYTPFFKEDSSGIKDYVKSKTYNKAFNTRINYTLGKANFGLVYENVDPTYRTFGAMYFNNDLENIGLTFSSPFFKDRLAIATQLGYQRDNLNGKKSQTSVRLVGSINASVKVSEKLNVTGSYSNFSATVNRRLNQFDYINMPDMVPADTLDYQQLSQTGNVNVNYVFGKNKNQNLNFNYSIAGQANKQGGIIRRGQASRVQNYNLAHSINFPSIQAGLNTSLNYTSNTTGLLDNEAYGGSVSVSKKFFENKFNTSFGTLYNQTTGSNSAKNGVFGLKLNMNYILLEKHNLSLYGIQMFRKTTGKENINDLTINFNYSYGF